MQIQYTLQRTTGLLGSMVIIHKEINRKKMKDYQLLENISKVFLTYKVVLFGWVCVPSALYKDMFILFSVRLMI